MLLQGLDNLLLMTSYLVTIVTEHDLKCAREINKQPQKTSGAVRPKVKSYGIDVVDLKRNELNRLTVNIYVFFYISPENLPRAKDKSTALTVAPVAMGAFYFVILFQGLTVINWLKKK